jgi:hypothetical protein
MEIARLLFIHFSQDPLSQVSATILFNPIQGALAVTVGCAPILKPLLFRKGKSVRGSTGWFMSRSKLGSGSDGHWSHMSETRDGVGEMTMVGNVDGLGRQESDVPVSERSLDFASLEEVRLSRS